MKDLNTVINIIKNEKIAAAKPKGKKKKVTGKAGYANVERGGVGAGLDEDYAAYDDDYDDFM
jgi:translation initiation factor 3 subunit J